MPPIQTHLTRRPPRQVPTISLISRCKSLSNSSECARTQIMYRQNPRVHVLLTDQEGLAMVERHRNSEATNIVSFAITSVQDVITGTILLAI